MIGYIYLTKNLANGRIYVGKKHLPVFNPDYLGSGVLLKKAVRKYGRDSFTVEMLHAADTVKELNKQEIAVIAAMRKIFSAKLYNIAVGGQGGNTGNYSEWTIERKEQYSALRKEEVAKGIRPPPIGNRGNTEFRHTKESIKQHREKAKDAHARAREGGQPYHSPEGKRILQETAREFIASPEAIALRNLSPSYQAVMQRRRDEGDARYRDLPEMLKTMSQSEAAAILGVDQSAVAQRVRDHAITVEHAEEYGAKIQAKRESAAKLAHAARRAQGDRTFEGHDILKMAETMTQAEIGRIVGVSQVRVSQRLRQLRRG